MPAQQSAATKLGRGRRPRPMTPQRHREEVYAAVREKRQADLKLKAAMKRARTAGVIMDIGDSSPNPDFKLRRRHLHIFPYGLSNSDHNHLVIELSSELSPGCIAELKAKVTNGKVTFDRDVFDGRWRVIRCDDELQMAAD